jgi:hypothetical protein
MQRYLRGLAAAIPGELPWATPKGCSEAIGSHKNPRWTKKVPAGHRDEKISPPILCFPSRSIAGPNSTFAR